MGVQNIHDRCAIEGQSTRRDFIAHTAAAVAAAGTALAQPRLLNAAHPYGDDTIRVALVGCGGRGTGAIENIFNADAATELVAAADVFQDRLDSCLDYLRRDHSSKLALQDRKFVGLKAYQRAFASDADLVVLATPPGFRPLHFDAAVDAGKHVFLEKPVAVDGPGVRQVLATGKKAQEKGLAVAVGLQRRHEGRYKQTIQRIHDGAIGEVLASRVYWNSSGVWVRERQPGQTELEYQLRNWYYFNWLCGDHIVEQHIHNIDVGNWVKGQFPVSASGMGGRQVRTGPQFGQIFDHHCVEFTYEDGSKMFSQCRHIPGAKSNVSEFVQGSHGSADPAGMILDASGNEVWSHGAGGGGHQQEQIDLIAQLRKGTLPNETEYGAMSTLTAILGRMATYSGLEIQMKDALARGKQLANVSQLSRLTDQAPLAPIEGGGYEIPVPGKTQVLDSRSVDNPTSSHR